MKMNENLSFLNFEGLDDEVAKKLRLILSPLVKTPDVKLPWEVSTKASPFSKGDGTFLNVHAPVFESSIIKSTPSQYGSETSDNTICYTSYGFGPNNMPIPPPHPVEIKTYQQINTDFNEGNKYASHSTPDGNGNSCIYPEGTHNGKVDNFYEARESSYEAPANSYITESVHDSKNISHPSPIQSIKPPFETTGRPNAGFKLNPTVSSFIPQSIPGFARQSSAITHCIAGDSSSHSIVAKENNFLPKQNDKELICNDANCKGDQPEAKVPPEKSVPDKSRFQSNEHSPKIGNSVSVASHVPPSAQEKKVNKASEHSNDLHNHLANTTPPASAVQPFNSRSFADVLKSKNEVRTSESVSVKTSPKENGNVTVCKYIDNSDGLKSLVEEDKLAIPLGRYLSNVQLNFSEVYLQPRGLVNRRNWCYINATLQALLACPSFYTLLRNLPLGPGVVRGKSSTPVIDSMVALAYEFVQVPEPQEDMQPGTPFQPASIYEMLGELKSDCVKGQQEDAEEFLSFILNRMHEEMVLIIKNYKKKYNLNSIEEAKTNGHTDASEGEEEWQVMGTKQKGMVTRKVVEHKTPISDLCGGQIKSFLTTNGNKTSASVQPFFTLQLDIQSDIVASVEEALNQMTIKEPIQGYTCTKTKQEVEAFSRITLQKLPPVLILHLKRFLYNKTGGCKKLIKQTEYPFNLELKKDLFSQEAKKTKRPCSYTLVAVMYHDGEEAIKGHYISDTYQHGSKSWMRCDDRTITAITEAQVLSYSPPRVPYLLFYHVNNTSPGNNSQKTDV